MSPRLGQLRATPYGFVLNGDGFDLSYGSHDPYATSLVQGGHFSNLSTAFDISEGANRLNINGVYMENVSRALLEVGPTDFSFTNSIFDDTNTFQVPAVGELTRRSLGSHYTGANVAIFGNDLWERTTLAAGSSTLPSTFFRTLETANTNGTTIYMGNQQLINGNFPSFFGTAGAPVTVVDTNYNPQTGNAIQKVTAVGVSLAATGDAAIIPIPSQITKYRVLGIDVGHCSASLTTALAGIWSAASKGGTNIAASQALERHHPRALALPPEVKERVVEVVDLEIAPDHRIREIAVRDELGPLAGRIPRHRHQVLENQLADQVDHPLDMVIRADAGDGAGERSGNSAIDGGLSQHGWHCLCPKAHRQAQPPAATIDPA